MSIRNTRPFFALALLAVAVGCGDNGSGSGSENPPPPPPPLEECGNGVVDPGEECDDGDANSDEAADACRTTCVMPTCGDAVVDSGEECDDGEGNSDVTADACRPSCVAATCGDAVVDSGEHCDLGAANSDVSDSECFTDCRGVWRFVSIPDFLSFDIADISAVTNQVQSTSEFHEAAIEFVLDHIASENPDFVMVAGDLVKGRWYQDSGGVGAFGPVTTLAEKEAAVALAADTYYAAWLERFATRGIPVHAALGDQDIGDINWPTTLDKSMLVDDFKSAWAKHFTRLEDGSPRYAERPEGTPFEDTAYAFKHKNMLVLSADLFNYDGGNELDPTRGAVAFDVTADQIQWIDEVFTATAADPEIEYLVVQGHLPVITPVRFQDFQSFNLGLDGGETSAFWDALIRGGVDLYLNGDVHHMSAHNAGGVEQISHGGIMGASNTSSVSYLVGSVWPDRIELELKSIDIDVDESSGELWQSSDVRRPFAGLALDEATGYVSAGTMVVDAAATGAEKYRDRTGFFHHFGAQPPATLWVHLPLDEEAAGKTPNLGLSGLLNRGDLEGGTIAAGGKIGNALTLADAERVIAGATPLAAGWSRTTAFWVKPDPTLDPTDPDEDLVTPLTFGRNGQGTKWDVDLDVVGGGVVELGVGGGRTNAAGSTSVTDGQWHHVALVMAEGSAIGGVLFYVDGQLISTSTNSSRVVNTVGEITSGGGYTRASKLYLGQAANSDFFQQYRGGIDDVAIWTRVLGAAEVQALVSLASTAGLNYHAGQVDALLAAFAAQTDVTIGSITWTYTATGLETTPGVVVEVAAGEYELPLGGGAGFVGK